MRLGIPTPHQETLESSIQWTKEHGFGAVYGDQRWCADESAARAYGEQIRAAGLLVAEFGAWSNPLSLNAEERRKAIEHCSQMLAMADAAEARCCVNIVGSVGEKWDGPCADDMTEDTYHRIVETVRTIVDAVNPRQTFYALETTPWMIPDSPQSYVDLLKAIDRPGVAVHFDPVNLVNCPRRYYDNAGLIREFVKLLGPQIRSVHVKDIIMGRNLTVHLDECRPGTGTLDHRTLIRELKPLDADLPLMLEHLPSTEEYLLGAVHVRATAAAEGVTI